MPVGCQVAILYCGTHALMSSIKIDQVKEFEKRFLNQMQTSHHEIINDLGNGIITDNDTEIIENTASLVCKSLQS